ncbi:hypothetical protein [Quatrionicoccus australiensis]|uniref:hypothetical protein n=1 Tax=Quatrionicoccus australiensis TaxID=138118 RepID=UPI001CFBF72B|nr:hypothetical protein [Quatrionicoccus australiensis]MCB4359570.1 hypothetical protein [Quatrionicoccus australiensis]
MTAHEVIGVHSPHAVQLILAASGIVFPAAQVPVSDVSMYFVAPLKPEVVSVRSGPNGYDLWTATLCPNSRKVGIKNVRHAGKWRDCLAHVAANMLRAA